MMDPAALGAALATSIFTAFQAEFAAEIAGGPSAFSVKGARFSQAMAAGIAAGLVPYLQVQVQVTDPAGTAVIGRLA